MGINTTNEWFDLQTKVSVVTRLVLTWSQLARASLITEKDQKELKRTGKDQKGPERTPERTPKRTEKKQYSTEKNHIISVK